MPASHAKVWQPSPAAPLQTSLFVSRARLAYEHWPDVTPSIRQQVIYQAKIEYHRGGEGRLKDLANEIRNPAGRIGLAFLIVAERAVHPPAGR